MTRIPKYSHQDVVEFLTHATAPDDLTCPIDLGLVRRPVRINGDTTQQAYEAETARRALNHGFRNPLTRALVTASPALIPDVQTQGRAQQFRAMLLGYTKVAAHMEEQNLPMPRDDGLIQPQASASHPAPSLREIASGQLIRNAFVAHTGRKPVKQPALARQFHQRAIESVKQSQEAIQDAKRASARAKEEAKQAEEIAEQARARQRTPLWSFDMQGEDLVREANKLDIPADLFKEAFGEDILAQVVETMGSQTADNWQKIADMAKASGHTLSDVLLFHNGAFLRAVLEDRAYEGLATQVRALEPRSCDGWHIGEMAGTSSMSMYVGEVLDGKYHGLGLNIKANGSVAGGQWQEDELHGTGQLVLAKSAMYGYWEQGVFRQGVMEINKSQPRQIAGFFSDSGINGWAVERTVDSEMSGLYKASSLVKGQKQQTNGITRLSAKIDAREENTRGCITGLAQGNKIYCGELNNGRANGFGMLLDRWGQGSAGLWENGRLTGHGSRSSITSIEYGIWSAQGFKMDDEADLGDEERILFNFDDEDDALNTL